MKNDEKMHCDEKMRCGGAHQRARSEVVGGDTDSTILRRV